MDELMLLAGKYNIELPDELLENVAGGLLYVDGLNTFLLSDDDSYEIEAVGRTKHMDAILKYARDNGISTEELRGIRGYKEWLGESYRRHGKHARAKVDIEDYYGLSKC